MISGYIEGIIRKLAGSYIKNFNTENLQVGLNGSITLSNLELNTTEFGRFHLLYRPSFIFVGSICIDFPVNAVLGGSLEIAVSDIMVVITKEKLENIDTDSIHRALQTWISTLYLFICQSESTNSKLSNTNIQYLQNFIDRLVIMVSSVHVRLEESFTCHVPFPVEHEIMCLGIKVSKVEFRPPSLKEFAEDAVFKTVSAKPIYNHYKTIKVNKCFKLAGVSAYCTREKSILSSLVGTSRNLSLLADFVKSKYSHSVL